MSIKVLRTLKFLFSVIFVAALAVIVLRFIFPLPDISQRQQSFAIPVNPATSFGALLAKAKIEHPGKTGVVPLIDGHEALGSRLILANQAQTSIDAQYYIWHDDMSGRILLKALYDAAQRGVRVRLLLDDNGVPGLDNTMATLNALPNFHIRLFNPSMVRHPKLLGYSFDFLRMNRRMHNKSFIVDGAVAIIGGRNIGNEYFKVGKNNFYLDMDVLGIGAIAPKTEAIFDQYWNSASVFDLQSIVPGKGNLTEFLAHVKTAEAMPDATKLHAVLASSKKHLVEGKLDIEWTNVKVIADDPIKGTGSARNDQLLLTKLSAIIGKVKQRMDIVSAYFVPGHAGTTYFSNLAQSGVRVRILTNALNTTDVLMVHSGYSKYRRSLLEAGVKLYELKLRSGALTSKEKSNTPGLSGASLHAKTFAMDNNRIFIGSFNIDPRSAKLNCEMGFLIESPTLAKRVSTIFDTKIPFVSYRPELTEENKMIWRESQPNGHENIYQEEPGATWLQQITLVVIGWLPVEWLL